MTQKQTNLDSQSNLTNSELTDQKKLDIKYDNIQAAGILFDDFVDEFTLIESRKRVAQKSTSDLFKDESTESKSHLKLADRDYNNEDLCLSAEELASIEENEIPHIWEPYFPKVGLVGICGASESGKSTIIRQLCLAICNNEKSFLGSKLNPVHNNTLYISTEDNALSSGIILKSQSKLYPNSLRGAKFGFNISNPLKFLNVQFSKYKFDLVVIDVWSDLYGDNPNDFSKVRKNLNQYSDLASKFETCICIIHHNTKHSEKLDPSKTNLNGSQAIEAKLRALLEVRVTNEQETMVSILKGNYISKQMKKKRLILDCDESLNFKLKNIVEIERAFIGNKSNNLSFESSITEFIKQGLTQDKMVVKLKEEYGVKAPSKGTVNKIVQKIKSSQSDKL